MILCAGGMTGVHWGACKCCTLPVISYQYVVTAPDLVSASVVGEGAFTMDLLVHYGVH